MSLQLRRKFCGGLLLGLGLWGVAVNSFADVRPPLELAVEPVAPAEMPGGRQSYRVSVQVPAYAGNSESELRLALEADGRASLGNRGWTISPVVPGRVYTQTVSLSMPLAGDGHFRVLARSYDAQGHQLWGRAQDRYVKRIGTRLLSSPSGAVDLERMLLSEQGLAGEVDERSRLQRLRALTEAVSAGVAGRAQAPHAAAAPSAVFDSVSIAGSARYTQRTAAAPNVFATAANARPIQGATVEFYDDKAGVQTRLSSTPGSVVTDSNGAYAATVPGTRSDGSAVQLVVKVVSDSAAARIGPIGIGTDSTLAYRLVSRPQTLDAATRTVDLLADNSNLTVLGAFALREGMLTAYDFVTANDARTGVGVNPSTIHIEYPGDNANGSYFSSNNGDHLNIGLNHGFDWDVYTHEYGHYIQKLNGTTQNPGGLHYINGSATGLNQGTRTLSKDQGIKLAWGEGWPTFFGTHLQIASGAGAYGIYGVGDSVYTDTANSFRYDLEANSDQWPGAGEDSELSVQRILWDFADAPQDGNDSVTFGTDDMWRQLNGGTKPVTLDQFRALFENLVPVSPAGYSTGSQNENRIKYGRIYSDMNVGPLPQAPADHYAAADAPEFRWLSKGASGGVSYRFNKFKLVFYNKDYSSIIFTSPEIPTSAGSVSADGSSASWKPTADDWNKILAGDKLIHWVVQGSNDTLSPATGPYYGLDRTIGGLSIAFVIDDTGSMGEDIAGVRDGLTHFISQLAAKTPPVKPLIEVVSFKDKVARRVVSNDLAEIQAVVDSLAASGGGDCPESSVEALLEAAHDLPSGGSGATIIFATDASPHAGYSLAGVQSLIRAKGIAITELLTGDCSSSGGLGSTGVSASSGAVSPATSASLAAAAARPPQPSASQNHDVYVTPRANAVWPLWPSDVACDAGCASTVGAGVPLSPNVFKLVGDFTLSTPGAVASYASIANASTKGVLLYFPEVKSGDTAAYSTALTNAALGAVGPAVIAASPGLGYSGSTLEVLLTGGSTNFSALSTVSFGDGITVNAVSASSATKLLANITIDAGAVTGPRDVIVSTPLGAGIVEVTDGRGQFAVNSAAVPLLESLQPSQVAVDTQPTLVIYGVGTHFDATSKVLVDSPSISVDRVVVDSATRMQVTLNVGGDTQLGFTAFSVQTGDESASFASGLLVVDSIASPPALPVLSAVQPNSGAQGQTLQLAIVGTNTHFINGETRAAISGDGVTVLSTQVVSETQVNVSISIAAGATLGFRDVLLTTSGETAAAVSGFQITANTARVLAVSPSKLKAGSLAVLVRITTENTDFKGNEKLSFSGDGITVLWTRSETPTQLVALINVAPAAEQGLRDISITSGDVVAKGQTLLEVRPPWLWWRWWVWLKNHL